MVLKTILISKSSCRKSKAFSADATTLEKMHLISNHRHSSSRAARQNRLGVAANTKRRDPPAHASPNVFQLTSRRRSRSVESDCRRISPFSGKRNSFQSPRFNTHQRKVQEDCESANSPIRISKLANDFKGQKIRKFPVLEKNTFTSTIPLAVSGLETSDFRRAERGGEKNNKLSQSSSVDQFDLEVMPVPLTNPLIPLHLEYHRRSRSVAHPNYDVGQEGHIIDVNVEASEEAAKYATSLLRQFDACFVKRSDGRWCYAILVERFQNEEEFEKSTLTFVVDESGSTKTMSWNKWGQYVRLVREPIEGSVLFSRLKVRIFGEDVKVFKKGLQSRLSRGISPLTTALNGRDGFDLKDPQTW